MDIDLFLIEVQSYFYKRIKVSVGESFITGFYRRFNKFLCWKKTEVYLTNLILLVSMYKVILILYTYIFLSLSRYLKQKKFKLRWI